MYLFLSLQESENNGICSTICLFLLAGLHRCQSWKLWVRKAKDGIMHHSADVKPDGKAAHIHASGWEPEANVHRWRIRGPAWKDQRLRRGSNSEGSRPRETRSRWFDSVPLKHTHRGKCLWKVNADTPSPLMETQSSAVADLCCRRSDIPTALQQREGHTRPEASTEVLRLLTVAHKGLVPSESASVSLRRLKLQRWPKWLEH